jgi:hypothetical protein
MVMMSRDWFFTVARSDGGSMGISGTLRMEGREECCGYFEVPMW